MPPVGHSHEAWGPKSQGKLAHESYAEAVVTRYRDRFVRADRLHLCSNAWNGGSATRLPEVVVCAG